MFHDWGLRVLNARAAQKRDSQQGAPRASAQQRRCFFSLCMNTGKETAPRAQGQSRLKVGTWEGADEARLSPVAGGVYRA